MMNATKKKALRERELQAVRQSKQKDEWWYLFYVTGNFYNITGIKNFGSILDVPYKDLPEWARKGFSLLDIAYDEDLKFGQINGVGNVSAYDGWDKRIYQLGTKTP